MTVECYGNITVDSTIPYEIELIQLSMSNEEGKDMGSWTADYVRDAGKSFLIKISDVQIFEEFRDGDSKVYLEGFVKVKFDIGRYGMKLDIPLKAEVSTLERKDELTEEKYPDSEQVISNIQERIVYSGTNRI